MAERVAGLAYQVLRGTGTAVDVIVLTQSDFQRKLQVPASLAAIAEREGGIVHAA